MSARLAGFSFRMLVYIALAAVAAGCGGGGGGGGGGIATSGTVTTTLSDPPSCKATLSNVWVTIADVKAHLNPDASPGDTGFVDLTPNLASSPMQIDLLSAPDVECLLATLGSTSGLPAGKYQQIRLILVANDATDVKLSTNGGTNECAAAGGFNCVQVFGAPNPQLLTLPSEANTGIKIPPGQLASGGLTVSPGMGLDIDIDFNACTSVVQAGHSGKFLLKPTLRAAELGTNPLVAGTVVVGTASDGSVTVPASPQGVPNSVVWLEQQSTSVDVQGGSTDTVENFIGSTMTDLSGHFEFCPVAPGNYDIVTDAVALPSPGAAISAASSNATVSTGISVSSSGGPNNLVIPLVAEAGGPGTVNAAFTTTNGSAGTADDITFTSLQQFKGSGGSSVQALVPFFSVNGAASTTPAVTTTGPAADTTCSVPPSGCSGPTPTVDCACVTYTVPNSNLVSGAANSTGSGYTIGTSATVQGSLDAIATQQDHSSSALTCSPSQLDTPPFDLLAPTPPPPPPSDAGTLAFGGCD
jgi:hypothetical protein